MLLHDLGQLSSPSTIKRVVGGIALDDCADGGEEASRARASRHTHTVRALMVGSRRDCLRGLDDLPRLIEQRCFEKPHLTSQHVEELRESLNPGIPQEMPELRGLPDGTDLSRCPLGRAKAQHLELSAAGADAGAPF